MRLLLILFAALFLHADSASAQTAQGHEQRCQDIEQTSGMTCVCSEPLQTNQNWDPSTGGNPNPTDTQTGSQWECGASGNFANFGREKITTVAGSSVGLPEVTWVQKFNAGGGSNFKHIMSGYNLTNKTVCQRSYRAENPNFYGANTSQTKRKINKWQGGPGQYSPHLWQNWANDGNNTGNTGFKYNLVNSNHSAWTFAKNTSFDTCSSPEYENNVGTVTLNEYKEPKWGYMERCADHNWDGSNRLRLRVRNVTRQGGLQTCVSDSTNTNSTATGTPDMQESFECGVDPGDPPDICSGGRYLTYTMIAVSDVNEQFWIGPASEIDTPGPPAAPSGTVTVTVQPPGTSPATIGLDGSGVNCPLCQSYAWTRTGGTGAGCTTGDIADPTAQTTSISGCATGTHIFNLRATNESGFHDAGDSATVSAAPSGGVGLGVRLLGGVGASGVGGVGGQ